MQQNYGEEIFFKEHQRFFNFFFNHLVDGVVCKLIEAEGQGLHWTNSKRLNEGEIIGMATGRVEQLPARQQNGYG
jgi:hypothetical protein